MKITDNVLIAGALTGELFFYVSKNPDERGELIRHEKNLIVTTGLNWVAQRIGGSSSPAPKDMSYMGVGNSTIAPTLSQTDLVAQLGVRTPNNSAQVTSNRVTFTSTFLAGNATGGITEAGLFDSVSGGVMMSRSVFPVVNKQVDDYMTVLWVISVGSPV